MAAEQLKRSNIVNALARNFNLSRDLLNRTLSSGAYVCKRAVFSAEGPQASWIFVVTQDDCFKPTSVVAYRKENNSVCKHEVCATDEEDYEGLNVRTTAVIRHVTQWLAARMPNPEVCNDTQAWHEMRNLYHELASPNKDTAYSATTVSAIEDGEKGLIAKMLYKSDLTTIAGRAYRIMVLRVCDNEGRDDLYKIAFYARQDDRTSFVSPVFGRVASCYNNGDHVGMLRTLHDQNYSDGIHKLEKEEYPAARSCVNITTPKCVDPTDPKTPIRDTSFTFLRTYAVVDTEASIDSNKYITLINDDGDEVSRRATHFVELPRKDKK